MSARATLLRVIDREADKLDKLSLASPTSPLGEAELERLELLTKALRAIPQESDDPPDDGEPRPSAKTEAELLQIAERT